MDDRAQGTDPSRIWVVPLAITVMVGFGVILYGFSVYATDQAAGAEFSKTTLSVAYGGSVFVGGLLALPVGHFADRHGVRIVIGAGALLGGLGLVGFSLSNHAWQVVAAWWLLVGPAQAMIYYEPAYVAIDQWSAPEDRAHTLATITLIGGLAGIVFIPLIAWVVTRLDWRQAVSLLGLLLFVVGASTALFALPRWNHRIGKPSDSRKLSPGVFRDRRFVLYTVALMLILLSTQGVIAHRVARFEEIGFSLATVALWAAVASALSLPGRWIAPRLAERFGATRVQAIIALVVTVSVLLMVNSTTASQMIGHFFLFGLAFGALLPLRAMVMGGWFSGPRYGRIMGAQWTGVVLTAAAGPLLVGVVRDATGSYDVSFAVLSVFFLAASGVILASGHVKTSRSDHDPTPSTATPRTRD
ncbi:MAG: MFS transporter [Acidimicrobiales bacterium]